MSDEKRERWIYPAWMEYGIEHEMYVMIEDYAAEPRLMHSAAKNECTKAWLSENTLDIIPFPFTFTIRQRLPQIKLLEVLRVQDTSHVTFLNTLQRQCRNQCSTNTTSVFSR